MRSHSFCLTACHRMNRRRKLTLTLILLVVAGSFATTQAQRTTLVSINHAGTGSGNLDSHIRSASSISADGRLMVFESGATDLVAGVTTNFKFQIYVRDLRAGTTTLISINRTSTAGGNGDSTQPVISSDGRFVAFSSSANDLVANDTNNGTDVFVRDLVAGTTTLVSVNRAGTDSGRVPTSSPGPFIFSFYPVMSANGRSVVFLSYAHDLVANDTNNTLDLFVRDIATGATSCVNVNLSGVPTGDRTSLTYGGAFDFNPVISADGRYVAFQSYVNDLVENDKVCYETCNGTNGLADIFVRDVVDNKTTLVSVNRTGTNSGNSSSSDSSISADGRFIAFGSFSTDLVTNDTTPQRDIYVRDMVPGITTLVSVNRTGTNGGSTYPNDPSGWGVNHYYPLISPDGRFVAFSSCAIDLAPNKTYVLPQDVFVRDLVAGTTVLVSLNRNGNDGRPGPNIYSAPAAFSADGRFLVFHSNADDLVANDTNNGYDIFVRDLMAGTTALVTVNREGTASSQINCDNCTASISADGRIIAFKSRASDLVDNDTNNTWDAFARINTDASAVGAEIRTWTLQGKTFAYVRLTFPDSNYKVADWQAVTNSGTDLFVNAAIERAAGEVVPVVTTTTAHIYELDALAAGDYTFTFKASDIAIKSLRFTVNSAPPPANPIDTAREFVHQHYLDFLAREPDGPGWDFWTDNITKCNDPNRRPAEQTVERCIDKQRETTSGAFFLSPEFQYTGYYVYRMYKGALGRAPYFSEFKGDQQFFVSRGIVVNNLLSAQAIESNKQLYAGLFIQRPDFKAIYDSLSNQQYVDKLFETTSINATAAQRQALVDALTNHTEFRATVLQKIVDGTRVISEGNQEFTTTYGKALYDKEFNRAFVYMEYVGYLRRDPDALGFNHWLGKLNLYGNYLDAEMVRSFLISPEYRSRFGQQ